MWQWQYAILALVFAGAWCIFGIALMLLVETLMGPDAEEDD